MLGAHTVYKLWLGQSTLGKSCGFSKVSFYQERAVPKRATAHIQTRWQQSSYQKNQLSF